ncbi:MAG TPA: carbohydrate ABC transporter permease [Clostridiaceae bacterium]|nr:carbohydrate ABC transporter permease [Clostridiaceae bacterium]
MARKGEGRIFTIFKYAFVYISAIITIIPVIYIILCGFKTTYQINKVLTLPTGLYLDNFRKVLENSTAMFSFINSIIITAGTLAICIAFCSIAAYPMGRRNDKIFKYLYIFFLSAMMIPAVANLAALYTLMKNIGLKNTRLGLILIYTALQTPMGILLYTSFIKTIPKGLDEAAVVDGCGYFKRFYLIIFPLLKPVTFTYAVISSIFVWNDFLMPLLLITAPDKKPVTLAVYGFVNEHQSDFGAIYAMLIIAMIPPVLLFLFNQKYFYKGITMGAIKG